MWTLKVLEMQTSAKSGEIVPLMHPHPGANLSQESSPSAASFGEEADDPVANSIVISSEMEAVMQTLTARERAVLTTLIEHGGRMTQAEIRYETSTPKSSLTGILISLERRKLITKKEWGRTNIIELSLWFLSEKNLLNSLSF